MEHRVSIPCDETERVICPDRPMCFMVEFDGVAVCKGVLKSMVNSLPLPDDELFVIEDDD